MSTVIYCCPTCGGPARVVACYETSRGHGHTVVCAGETRRCRHGGMGLRFARTPLGAIRMWNRRVAEVRAASMAEGRPGGREGPA